MLNSTRSWDAAPKSCAAPLPVVLVDGPRSWAAENISLRFGLTFPLVAYEVGDVVMGLPAICLYKESRSFAHLKNQVYIFTEKF